MMSLVGFCWLILLISSLSQCGRILFIPAHNAPSHAKTMYMAGEILKQAGHQVSLLQLIDHPSRETKNKVGVIDRVIHSIHKNAIGIDERTMMVRRILWKKPTESIAMFHFWKHLTDVCVRILSHHSTRNAFYGIMNETWDVIFMDDLSPMCGLVAIENGLSKKGVMIVDFSAMALYHSSMETRGLNVPTYIGPNFEEPDFDYVRFMDRLKCAWHRLQFMTISQLVNYLIPHWGGEDLGFRDVTLRTLPEKSSFAITATPNGLDYTQPRALDVVEFHIPCLTESLLPEPCKSFIEDPSSRGTILFAMGHFVDWTYAPPGAVEAFAEAFARFPDYRIIWQFDSNSGRPKGLTSNVLTLPWLPQLAILNHAKTKLFITHMGLKSMKETICAKVPAVALPMFFDHYRNTAVSRHRGFAVYLDKTQLTPSLVYSSMKQVLDDSRYATAVRRLHNQLNDRIRNASSLFAFQLDFFLRRNDERVLKKYIRSKWNNLSFLTRWWQTDVSILCLVFALVTYSILQ